MRAFTPDAVRTGASTDLDLRLAAAERAATTAVPTADEEVWRYSRIRELDLDALTPARATTTVEGGDPAAQVVVGAALGELAGGEKAVDLFHELNTAFMDVVLVRVGRGKSVSEPIVITHRFTEAGVA